VDALCTASLFNHIPSGHGLPGGGIPAWPTFSTAASPPPGR